MFLISSFLLFLVYCVSVFACFFFTLFSCVSLIVYKFSPPLPRLFFLYFQLVPLLQMIVIISISYMLCVLCLDFLFLFCFILVSPTCDDVRQERNENGFHFSQDFGKMNGLSSARLLVVFRCRLLVVVGFSFVLLCLRGQVPYGRGRDSVVVSFRSLLCLCTDFKNLFIQ